MHEQHTMKAVRGRKKRDRAIDSKKENLISSSGEDNTDATSYSTASSSDDEEQGISTLLNAAASIEADRNIIMLRLTEKMSRTVSISDKPERRKPMARISTLLQVATTMVEKDQPSAANPPSSSSVKREEVVKDKDEGEEDEEDEVLSSRPKKRLASMAARSSLPRGEEIYYPAEDELEEATTRRSRNALFSWYDRLRDLYDYGVKHGDCMVPQKYNDNHALGIVRNLRFLWKPILIVCHYET
jgi:hypothetical protein